MAKYIVINRDNGYVTIVRSQLETASEDPLTEHEEIINELFEKVKKLNKPAVIKALPFTCGSCGSLFAKKPEHAYCPICKVYNIKGNDL